VLVDQFEQAWVAHDDAARPGYLDAVAALADLGCRVVLTLRADHVDRCSEHPRLRDLVTDGTVLLGPLSAAELTQVITGPAELTGCEVEPALVDRILNDVRGLTASLPLVSTALLETWVRRSADMLTMAGYAEAGGVRGAVSRLADGVYDGLDAEAKAATRHIFLRLADPHGATDDVRRRARHDEVASTDIERRVLTTLINHRLVTATGDAVEVAHEALLREWPRLRGWLEEDRAGRQLHRQLTEAAGAWEADNRDDAGLYRGVRLQAARDWAASHPGDPNPTEGDFLSASGGIKQRSIYDRKLARKLRLEPPACLVSFCPRTT
jgi:hypothetical protein